MEFAKRMDRFGEGIFSVLLGMKKEQLAQGRHVVDLSVGTPNIPPAQHVIDALVSAAQDRGNYVYAISDTAELQDAVAAWYRRRYGVEVDPRREVVSLLGSQEGLAHIALSVVDEGETVLVPDPCYPVFGGGRSSRARSSGTCPSGGRTATSSTLRRSPRRSPARPS